jgi:hypothetical protein
MCRKIPELYTIEVLLDNGLRSCYTQCVYKNYGGVGITTDSADRRSALSAELGFTPTVAARRRAINGQLEVENI